MAIILIYHMGVLGYMLRRGILVILAGIFWLAGATAMYQRIEASAMLPICSFPEAENSLDLDFPFLIPGTDLMALEMINYNGIYLEDGSREGVSNVAGLILRNDGKRLVEYANVELWQGQSKLCFELSYLPESEKILVLESNRGCYLDGKISNCIGYEKNDSGAESGSVTVRQVDSSMLLVKNSGPLPLKNITVYYKNYDYGKAMYLGGIVYEIPIRSLAPGETFFSKPMYYSPQYSRIVKTKTSG